MPEVIFYEKTDNFDCIRAKQEALRIIRDDLLKKKKTGVVLTGGVSDPYNPEEKEHKLTRNALELINAFRFGICIITKSDLVKRDMDILLDIKEHSPTSVNFSITCSDDETCMKVEPFVSTTTKRFEAIEHLAKNGIITGVLMDPVIPYITDTVENIQEMVKKQSVTALNTYTFQLLLLWQMYSATIFTTRQENIIPEFLIDIRISLKIITVVTRPIVKNCGMRL